MKRSGTEPTVSSDVVQVRYNIASPRDARINSFLIVWGLSIIMLLIGILIIAIGFKYKRNNALIDAIRNM